MKIERFNTLNEAKNPDTKKLTDNALKYILVELGKNKLSRHEMVQKIEDKFEGEKEIEKVAGDVADDIMHNDKLGVKSESFKGSKTDPKKFYPYFFVGSDAKDPKGLEKKEGKKEEPKKGKIEKFDTFKTKEEKEPVKPKKVEKDPELDEEEAKRAKSVAKKDMKKDKKVKSFDSFEKDNKKAEKEEKEKDNDSEKGRRKYNFAKDSGEQLSKKLGDEKYKKDWSDIKSEIEERPKKKGRK